MLKFKIVVVMSTLNWKFATVLILGSIAAGANEPTVLKYEGYVAIVRCFKLHPNFIYHMFKLSSSEFQIQSYKASDQFE